MLQQCLKGELHYVAFPCYPMLVTDVEIPEMSQECPADEEAFEAN